MANTTRQSMIEATQRLIASHGSHGTSFGDVIAASGAPRGSLYHHFPGGKEELVETALAASGDAAFRALEALRGSSATEVVAGFLDLWRRLLVHTDFTVGCAVAGVTVDAESSELVGRSGQIFRDWTGILAELLTEAGVPSLRAGSLATLLVAGSEGAVIVARAQRDMAPFEQVAAELQALIGASVTAG